MGTIIETVELQDDIDTKSRNLFVNALKGIYDGCDDEKEIELIDLFNKHSQAHANQAFNAGIEFEKDRTRSYTNQLKQNN